MTPQKTEWEEGMGLFVEPAPNGGFAVYRSAPRMGPMGGFLLAALSSQADLVEWIARYGDKEPALVRPARTEAIE